MQMKNNKGLTISIIILACTIVIGSSIMATKVSTAINMTSIDGIFSGMMLPYFTVDGQYYFCKAELDNWLKEVANEHTEYNTAEGWRKQKITF